MGTPDEAMRARRSLTALGNLIERTAPWLLGVGSWIFGGVIAFNLVIMSSLITVGPVDAAVRTSITALACALPLDVAGIILLRLVTDVGQLKIDDLTLKAFRDARFPEIDVYFPPSRQQSAVRRRRSRIALLYSIGIGAFSVALTLVGLVAALWHMAWWVGVVLCGMVVFSALLLLVVIVHTMPPQSNEEQAVNDALRGSRS
jgi:hypothetical protein